MRMLVLTGCLLPATALGATWRVGSTGAFSPGATAQPTVSDALAAASDGDVIELGAGTFDDKLSVDVDVTLRSVATGATPTTLGWSGSGIAVSVLGGAEVSVEGVRFTTLNDKRCMRVVQSSTVTLTDATFEDCTHTTDGGALFVQSGATATARRTTFTATPGLSMVPADGRGGFVLVEGSLVVRGGRFAGGTATQGGAVFVDGGDVDIGSDTTFGLDTTDFEDNTATGGATRPARGGALAMAVGAVTVAGAVFSTHHADDGGGHVSADGGTYVDLDSAYVLGTALDGGGALHLTGGATLSLVDAEVRVSSTSGDRGGALFAVGATDLQLFGALLRDAESALYGGAIYVEEGGGLQPTLVLGDTALELGRAPHGAGLYAGPGATVEIEGGSLTDHVATGDGGCIALDGADVTTLSDGTLLSECAAGGDGGALWWSDDAASDTLSLAGVDLSDATAVRGAGLFVTGGGALSLADVDATLTHAAQTGGLLHQTGGSLTARRVDVCDATAASGPGGGLHLDAPTPTSPA